MSLDIPDPGWSIRLVKAESRTSTLATPGIGEAIFIISRRCSENEVLSLIDSHKGAFLSNKEFWKLSRHKMPNIGEIHRREAIDSVGNTSVMAAVGALEHEVGRN